MKNQRHGCRSKVFSVMHIEEQPALFSGAWFYWIVMFAFSLTAICCYVAETTPMFYRRPWPEDSLRNFRAILFLELTCMSLLALDFILRCICSPKKWRYLIKPFTILELIYFIFYYVSFIIMVKFEFSDDLTTIISTGYSVVRVFAIVRVLGVIRLLRFFETTHVIAAALKRNYLAFGLLITLVSILSLTYGSLIYYAEKQQESFDQVRGLWLRPDNSTSPFQSIHGSMWWAITTLVTVGYGDAVPQTDGGKVVGAITMVTGVLCLALPTGIVASTFSDIWREYVTLRQAKQRTFVARLKERQTREAGDISIATSTSGAIGAAMVEMEQTEKIMTGKKSNDWVPGSVNSTLTPLTPLTTSAPKSDSSSSSPSSYLAAEEVVSIVEQIRKYQHEIDGLLHLLEAKALLQVSETK